MRQSNAPTKIMKLMASFFGLAILTCFSLVANAQETRSAILTNDGIVQISEDHTPDGRFVFDISHMEFDSDSEMTSYFQSRCGENYVLRALPHENKVFMIIRGDKQPDWTVSDWNNHLSEQLADKAIVPNN